MNKMRVIKEVPLHLIDVDREPCGQVTLGYAVAMSNGDVFPPVKLAKLKGGRFRLLDGRHRFLACKLNGRKTINARFSTEEYHNE